MNRGTNLLQQLWSKTDIPTKDCWEWTGVKNQDGYGRVRVNGKLLSAHRVVYAQLYGPIPEGLNVLHNCDNPGCVNPTHLRLGTQTDNLHDAYDRERRGKLTWDDVNEIRRRYNAGGVRQRDLAEEYGIYQSMVSQIVRYKSWVR